MGRAGRRARDALTILVTDERPIDQHYVNNPEELFSTVRLGFAPLSQIN